MRKREKAFTILQYIILIASMALLIIPIQAKARSRATTNAYARIVVVSAATTMEKMSLDFADSGDREFTIPARSRRAARLVVLGRSYQAFNIILPGKTSLSTSGQKPREVQVDRFSSFPSGTTYIESSGSRRILVGATRGPLTPASENDRYFGSYLLTVAYQ